MYAILFASATVLCEGPADLGYPRRSAAWCVTFALDGATHEHQIWLPIL